MDDKMLQSVVIVKNLVGYTATIRFTDGSKDECLSSGSRESIYRIVEKVVNRKLAKGAQWHKSTN